MNKNSNISIITLITITLMILAPVFNIANSAPPIDQQIITVDINGNGDYTNIQDAINNALPTNIIKIKPGIYQEHNISISNKIELIGEDINTTIISCSGNPGIRVTSSYVDISHLQIINTSEYAIQIKGTGCTISYCNINVITSGDGIYTQSSYNAISHCNLYGAIQSGVGITIQGEGSTIDDCMLQHFSSGMIILLQSDNNKIINCNVFDNENAIDIRIKSNNNIVTKCNIYSNLQGVKIWQNSNNNSVYLNNVFKNDYNAIDESTNNWDNDKQGNYWGNYEGTDANNDNIGDTPFIISEENQDNFPSMKLLLPDIVIAPTDIKQTTSLSDTTPTFTWVPAVYIKEIQGYYVKIDNNQEVFIGNATIWTSTITLSNGVHTLYVRAIGADQKSSSYATIAFPIDTTIKDADGDGWSDAEEQQYGTNPNDPDNYPLDTDGDHVPDSVDVDDDNDGYTDDMEFSYLTNQKDKYITPLDTDKDGIPDDNSLDGKYIGDADDDNDGLSDTIERYIGSNPKDSSDVKKIYITGSAYYLVDISKDDTYDVLYDPSANATSGIEKYGENYLIDQNRNTRWDHIYNTLDGSVSLYGEQEAILTLTIWISIIIAIIITAAILIYYIRKRPVKPVKTQRIIKKPIVEIEKPPIIKTEHPANKTEYPADKKEMIDETKTLLKLIHQDFTIYMDRLQQITEQMVSPQPQEKEKKTDEEIVKTPIRKKHPRTRDIEEIEFEIDNLLFTDDESEADKENKDVEKSDVK